MEGSTDYSDNMLLNIRLSNGVVITRTSDFVDEGEQLNEEEC
jgi:hypothetical protein